MSTVRRWYIYLVNAISLQAVTWAAINLLRNMLIRRLNPPTTAVAFQIAVILVGLPVFLVHWLWGQRLATKNIEERKAALRHFYLYGTMAAFLGPFISNAYALIRTLLQAQPTTYGQPRDLTLGDSVVFNLLAMLVLALLWFYHQRIAAEDSQAVPETNGMATVRRIYVLGFSIVGLTMTTLAVIDLSRWVMMQFGNRTPQIASPVLTFKIMTIRLTIGVPLWLIFWRWAQELFAGQSPVERESALRKVYLYGVVFVGSLSAVASATAILAGFFRRVILRATHASTSGDDIRIPLSIIIGTGLLWAYHALVIRDDALRAKEAPRQAGIRRLYLYLIATVGLTALLIGLAGDISVILRALGKGFGTGLWEELSWFSAAIIAGLPVWLIPWQRVQNRATQSDPAGAGERSSLVRKIYLYFFLFAATMTMLSSAVFIIYMITSSLLGAGRLTLSELGQAIAFALIAGGVLFYHGSTLRSDHSLFRLEQVKHLNDLNLAVVDLGDGHFGRAVVEELKRESPELDLEPILLAPPGEEIERDDKELAERLAQAGVIIGPWTIAIPGGGDGAVSPQVSRAVTDSTARKILVPTREEGWEWAGVDRWDSEALVRHTMLAIKQIAAGEQVKAARPLGVGAIIAIVAGVLFLLIITLTLLGPVIDSLFI